MALSLREYNYLCGCIILALPLHSYPTHLQNQSQTCARYVRTNLLCSSSPNCVTLSEVRRSPVRKTQPFFRETPACSPTSCPMTWLRSGYNDCRSGTCSTLTSKTGGRVKGWVHQNSQANMLYHDGLSDGTSGMMHAVTAVPNFRNFTFCWLICNKLSELLENALFFY